MYRSTSIIARALLPLLALVTGCASIGPSKLVSTHEGYNDAVQLTMTREVLKNIVRLRYADPLQFITVASINAQFSVGAAASVGASGLGTAGAAGETGGNVAYSEAPTITYIPQSDASFYKSMEPPLELEEAIGYVFNWSRFRPEEMGLVIAAINDAPDRAGAPGEAYRKRVTALAGLFERGATLQHFREFYPRHAAIPVAQVDGLAYVDAARSGFFFYDAGANKLQLASKRFGLGLVVPRPHAAATEADLRLLGLTPGKRLYPIRSPAEAEPEPFGLQPDTVWLTPRSVEAMLELAATGVEVPPQHALSGVAPGQPPTVSSSVVLPLRIRYAAERPASPYRIRHRGYWFYIDDTDTVSKILFSALVHTYSSRLGSESASGTTPQIVLPIGG